ncbi:MAG: histidine phosphatase family protein [Candidatus Margulisiibacteriota bacterium]
MIITNRIKIVNGRLTSKLANPLSYDLAARADLVHTAEKLIAGGRFSRIAEVREHLDRNEIGPDRAIAVFVRHPSTVYSEIRKLAGSEDIPLSETGRTEALKLKTALRGLAFSFVFSSHLSRARLLAAEIAADLGLPHRTEPALGEINCGTWHHCFFDRSAGGSGSIEARLPTSFRLLRDRPHRWKAPGGESFSDVADRTGPVVGRAVRSNLGRAFLMVGHAWANGVIAARAFGVHLAHLHPLIDNIAPTAITVIEFSSDLSDNHLWLWADAGHLETK